MLLEEIGNPLQICNAHLPLQMKSPLTPKQLHTLTNQFLTKLYKTNSNKEIS